MKRRSHYPLASAREVPKERAFGPHSCINIIGDHFYAVFAVTRNFTRVVSCSTHHDAEKILRAWIAVRGEHAVKALARLVDLDGSAFKANGGIHQTAPDRLARTGVARQISVDRFRKERLTEPRVVPSAFQDRAPKMSCKCHFKISEQ